MSADDPLDRIKHALASLFTEPETGDAPTKKAAEAADEEVKTDPYAPFEMARQAIDRYRTTVKWIVGAYVAIWTVLVGTAPFAGLGGLDTTGMLIAGGGLLVAGIGALSGIYAASRVLEPEDASLGELTHPGDESSTRSRLSLRRLLEGDGETRARKRRDELFKAEGGYFGPDSGADRTTSERARDLIEKIQTAEQVYWTKRIAAAGAAEDQRAAKDRDAEVAELRYDQLQARRSLTLAVAAIYEVRGKYWTSRRLLINGAILVLAGTLMYLSQVVAEEKDDEAAAASSPAPAAAVTPARIRLKPETWRPLNTISGAARCFAPNAEEGKVVTDGYVLGEVPATGPWTVVALPTATGDARCRPVTLDVKLPAGRVLPAPMQASSG